MLRTVGLALSALAVSGCVSLDSFFFNPRAITEDYKLEDTRVPMAQREIHERPISNGTIWLVYAFHPGAEEATAPTIIYHHGNASNIDGYWNRAAFLYALGANVVIYDYPGYGKSTGTLNEAGIYEAADSAVQFVFELGTRINRNRIYNYGFSLGGAPATEMAYRYPAGTFQGLMLEAPFTSVAGLAADGSFVVPSSFVMTHRFDNLAKIPTAAKNGALGTLILHGSIDDFVQTHFGQQLDQAIADLPTVPPHCLVIVPNANHGDVPCAAPRTGSGCNHTQIDPVYEGPVRGFLMATTRTQFQCPAPSM